MTRATGPLTSELLELANLYCEERLLPDQVIRLNDLLRQHHELVRLFVEFIQLHGQLTWDVGHHAHTGYSADAGQQAFEELRLNDDQIVACELDTDCEQLPVVVTPVTSRPVTSRPVTSRPVTSRPVTSRPATSRPATSRPATSRPATSRPAAVRRGESARAAESAYSGKRLVAAAHRSSADRRLPVRLSGVNAVIVVACGVILLVTGLIWRLRDVPQLPVEDSLIADRSVDPVEHKPVRDLVTRRQPSDELVEQTSKPDGLRRAASTEASFPGEAALVADRLGTDAAGGMTEDPDSLLEPLRLNAFEQPAHSVVVRTSPTPGPDTLPEDTAFTVRSHPHAELDDRAVIARIDELLQQSWDDHGIGPGPQAVETEWLRRAYLTFTGRIPTIGEARDFLSGSGGRERDRLVQKLMQDERTSEHLAVIWLNLLIGRSNPRDVDAESLRRFLVERFQRNEAWIDTVGELIAAEGRSDQNGATNFLLAHLNDQATPATAVTARLFLGQQVHCTQCHDHPFSKDSQEQFWALNAFFKQAERGQVSVELPDGLTGTVWELHDSASGGRTFYETLRGQIKLVVPEFAGVKLDEDDSIQRRSELVRLLHRDPEYRVAQAMVNRMWYHFFGAGFTIPVDDMGPHNPPSHPRLLQFLTQVYVQSAYDTRRLMMWLAMSSAWQRSSVYQQPAVAGIGEDRGQGVEDLGWGEGHEPLFTRIYPRYMLPEQMYDSIRVAIRSIAQQPIESSLGSVHQREWVGQFVESYGTDENDERLQFDGNISQALLMMNGRDLEDAIPLAVSAMIAQSGSGRRVSSRDFLERICLAVLSRRPTSAEEDMFRRHLRTLNQSAEVSPDRALQNACEDMLWAFLNSSEFATVH